MELTVDVAIAGYVAILEAALPICIVFHLANLIVSTFLRAAFGGELRFRS